jgi:hypothetical protein
MIDLFAMDHWDCALSWKTWGASFVQLKHLDWIDITFVSLANNPKYKICTIESFQLQMDFFGKFFSWINDIKIMAYSQLFVIAKINFYKYNDDINIL